MACMNCVKLSVEVRRACHAFASKSVDRWTNNQTYNMRRVCRRNIGRSIMVISHSVFKPLRQLSSATCSGFGWYSTIKPLLVLRPSATARLGLRLHSATRPKICFFAIHYTSFKSHDTHRGHEGVDATRQVATMSAPRLRLPNIIFVIASNVDVRQAQLFCGELLILQAPNKEIVPSSCISPCPNPG